MDEENRNTPKEENGDQLTDLGAAVGLSRVAAKACVVTWFNPQAILDGTMLFGGFRAGNPGGVSTQLILGSSEPCVHEW